MPNLFSAPKRQNPPYADLSLSKVFGENTLRLRFCSFLQEAESRDSGMQNCFQIKGISTLANVTELKRCNGGERVLTFKSP